MTFEFTVSAPVFTTKSGGVTTASLSAGLAVSLPGVLGGGFDVGLFTEVRVGKRPSTDGGIADRKWTGYGDERDWSRRRIRGGGANRAGAKNYPVW